MSKKNYIVKVPAKMMATLEVEAKTAEEAKEILKQALLSVDGDLLDISLGRKIKWDQSFEEISESENISEYKVEEV